MITFFYFITFTLHTYEIHDFRFFSSEIVRRCRDSELDIKLLKHKISKKTFNRVNNNTLFKLPMETVVLDKQVISIEDKTDVLKKFYTIDHLLFFFSFVLFMVHVDSGLIRFVVCRYVDQCVSLIIQIFLGLGILFIQWGELLHR